jgi:hypothetical protein
MKGIPRLKTLRSKNKQHKHNEMQLLKHNPALIQPPPPQQREIVEVVMQPQLQKQTEDMVKKGSMPRLLRLPLQPLAIPETPVEVEVAVAEGRAEMAAVGLVMAIRETPVEAAAVRIWLTAA